MTFLPSSGAVLRTVLAHGGLTLNEPQRQADHLRDPGEKADSARTERWVTDSCLLWSRSMVWRC